jgi:hypothetical protein
MHDRIDEPVGEFICQVSTQDGVSSIFCDATVQAFEFQQGNSYFNFDSFHESLNATWDPLTRQVTSYHLTSSNGEDWQAVPQDGQLVLTVQDAVHPADSPDLADLPSGTLLPLEWFFRLTSLDFASGGAYQVGYAWPSRWDPQKETSTIVLEALPLSVGKPEDVQVPAGDYTAYPLQIGDSFKAWYQVDFPAFPVRIQDEVFDYLLLSPPG